MHLQKSKTRGILLLFAFLLVTVTGFAQSGKKTESTIPSADTPFYVRTPPPVITASGDTIYISVQEVPQYRGGTKAMFKFFSENLRYPASAKKDKIQGRQVVPFIVDKKGKIGDIKLGRNLSPDCDQEVIRLLSIMPDWIPGRQNGRNVNVYYTLPINIKPDAYKTDY